MKLGKKAMEALQAEIWGKLKAGDELVVIGAIALKGTSMAAAGEYDRLRKHFSAGFLKSAIDLPNEYGVGEFPRECEAWKMAREAGATALYAMRVGGFLSGLWKMAEASSVGLEAEFTRIPIRQETIEICEVLDLNPYKLLSDGAILVGIPAGEALVQELRRKGLMASVIGQTNDGNDRLLYYNGNGRYLERPAKDEIYKVTERISEN